MHIFTNIRAGLAAGLIGLAALLAGCATIATPENSQTGVIGIDMVQRTITPLGIKAERMSYAPIFVRLDDQGRIPSTSEWRYGVFRDGYWYLLNAKPGSWVAVGTSFEDTGLLVDTKMATLFPEALVRASEVELKPGKAAYMGRFQILEAPDVDKMDPVQIHYLNSVLANEIRLKREDIASNIVLDFKSAGSAISVQHQEETSEAVKKAGLESMKKALGVSWSSRFE
ncbi:MAG: hypothetical protein OEV26_03435 [Gallionella sp.]|nr:hypothetical protein [Gallionella sp.]MDH4286456.1 hypothetical protein [Gallionella sp.]